MDDVVVWRSNGQIPFADMLLDFVQIGQIDMEMAERSANQKNVEQSVLIPLQNRHCPESVEQFGRFEARG